MAEEKKELQNEDVENVSGGLSLEGAKKFAKKHKKGLIGAAATAGAALGSTWLYKNRDALLGQEDPSQEDIKISLPDHPQLVTSFGRHPVEIDNYLAAKKVDEEIRAALKLNREEQTTNPSSTTGQDT